MAIYKNINMAIYKKRIIPSSKYFIGGNLEVSEQRRQKICFLCMAKGSFFLLAYGLRFWIFNSNGSM